MYGSIPLTQLLRHPVEGSESLESSALLVAGGVFAVGAGVAGFAFWGRELPIAGRGSVGQFVALGSAVASMATFIMARAMVSANHGPPVDGRPGLANATVRLRWYDLGALALAHAIIALLGWLGIADMTARSFTGAVLFAFPAAMLAAVALAVGAYAVFLSAARLTPMLLSLVLVVFLAVGTFASMLSATDPLWWQKNLSTLGISNDISALAFNLTLIIAGFILVTIAHYATATLPARDDRERQGKRRVHTGLVLMGVLLMCVGLLPVDDFYTLHTLAAGGMAVIYVALVLALPSWVPAMPRVFILLGHVFVAIITLLGVFFATGHYNLTAVELIAFILIFAWLIVFLRNSAAMAERTGQGTHGDSGSPHGGRNLP